MIGPPNPLALTPSLSPSTRREPGHPATLPGPAGPKPAGRISPASPSATGRELALPYAALALARMAEMIGDPDPKVALAACREIIDRAWGKTEASSRGPAEEDGPVVVVVQTREIEDA